MIDDTKHLDHGTIPSRINLSREVNQILNHQIVRAHAERWSHDLRFLTYDEPGPRHDEVAPRDTAEANDEIEQTCSNATNPITGPCDRFELDKSVLSGHHCESRIPTEHMNKTREIALKDLGEPTSHACELTCGHCRHIPMFPNQGTITTFKIRRLDPEAWLSCRHFVAISYCWAAQTQGDGTSPMEPYKVVEEDGSVRNMRASSSTIDRAVEFARHNGFRMLWIDQECIEQDKPSEKVLAVQAMDLVYLEARTSIALLHSHLKQKHLDALLQVYEINNRHNSKKRPGRQTFQGYRRLDHTVLTEAVSLIVNDKWNTRAWVLQEAFVSSGNMILLFPRSKNISTNGLTLVCHELSRSEIAIRLDTVVQCIRSCLSDVSAILKRHISGTNRPNIARTNVEASSHEFRKTLERIELFHPQLPRPGTAVFISLNQMRAKRTCSAAVALTYLRLRDLQLIPDKLAIVANMCGYTLRLDTTQLGKTQESRSLCIIAMSLANGDLSLITPELYRFQSKEHLADASLVTEANVSPDFSWSRAFCSRLAYVHADGWNTHGNTASLSAGSPTVLSHSGISLLGMIWNIDRYIDMERLKRRYSSSWGSLNQNLATTPPSRFELATTHMLFEIIEDLISRDEIQTADAILNSTSNPWWLAGKSQREAQFLFGGGIESVTQFPSGLNLEKRRGMFSLDHSDDGRFYQCWIIDRVMDKGGFWVGGMVNPTESIRYLGSANNPTQLPARLDPQDKPNFSWEGHQSQLYLHWLSSNLLSLSQNLGNEPQGGEETNPKSAAILQNENLALYGLTLRNLERHEDSREKATREMDKRRGIFNLDGDVTGKCLVFQPFNMALESIPRPQLRSMGVSWKVERVDNAAVGHGVNAEYTFTTHGGVKGMWKYNLNLGHRVVLV